MDWQEEWAQIEAEVARFGAHPVVSDDDRKEALREIARLQQRCRGLLKKHGRGMPRERQAAMKLFCSSLAMECAKLETLH